MAIDFTNIMKDKKAYLSMEEINRMLQYCYDKGKIRDYMLIVTLARTGRRIGEIVGKKPYTRAVGLRPCDILPDNLIEFDVLKKNHVKSFTKRGIAIEEETLARRRIKKMPIRRLFPVDDDYYDMIQSYIKSNNIGTYKRVFPITQQRAGFIIRDVAKKSGVKRHVHPHMFRHSYAINLLKDNPNDAGILKQVQDLLAHSDIKVTMAYAQFTPYDKRKSLNKLFGDG